MIPNSKAGPLSSPLSAPFTIGVTGLLGGRVGSRAGVSVSQPFADTVNQGRQAWSWLLEKNAACEGGSLASAIGCWEL